MELATFTDFAAFARRLAVAARALGLAPPDFRSPPHRPGVDRTLRRRADGGAVVAVVIRGRPGIDVAGDLVDGVLVANRLSGDRATAARERLLDAAVCTGTGRSA